jgi:hypothetical protein
MACNCIDRVEAELRKNTGDDEAFLETVYDVKEKVRRFNAKGFYRGKFLDKFLKKNFSLAYVSFDYCPFCGKKYVEGAGVKEIRIMLKRDRSTAESDFLKGIEYNALVNRHGRVYLQDTCGEKIYLKPCDYVEVGHD